MEEEYLEKNDVELIRKLYNISSNIEQLYKKLIELESTGKKDSEEYQKYLGYLNMLIEIEDNYYSNINMSFDKIKEVLDNILLVIGGKISSLDDHCALDQNYDNSIAIRICKKLYDLLKSDSESFSKFPKIKAIEANISQEFNGIANVLEIDKIYCKKVMIEFMGFLQKEIDDELNKGRTDDLIKAKYYMTFRNKDLEKEMISKGFNISSMQPSVDEKGFANSHGMNVNKCTEYRNVICGGFAAGQMDKIFLIKDLDYSNPKDMITSILRRCYLRASLLMLDEDTFNMINDANNKYLDQSDPNVEVNFVSRQLIKMCLDSYKSDKEAQRKLKID